MFLIDCHKHMFNETLEEEKAAPFYFALKCAVHAYCDKIISSPSDLLGVVFYGTVTQLTVFVYIYFRKRRRISLILIIFIFIMILIFQMQTRLKIWKI